MHSHLVEVGLQEVDLGLVLEQARPELLLEILLPQHQFNVTRRVVDLALLGINLLEEFELDVVGGLFRVGVSSEVEESGLNVEFDLLGIYVWDGDGEVDMVLLRVAARRSLRPGNLPDINDRSRLHPQALFRLVLTFRGDLLERLGVGGVCGLLHGGCRVCVREIESCVCSCVNIQYARSGAWLQTGSYEKAMEVSTVIFLAERLWN